MEKLVECKRCGGNACYEQPVSENITTWLCMGCGFTTSTEMVKDGKLIKEAIETAPALYTDIMFTHSSNQVWLPSTITLPAKGMVFVDGTDRSNWKWAAVQAIEITEEDRKVKQYPVDQTHRMDMQNAKSFGQKDFMDAMEYIGFFTYEN